MPVIVAVTGRVLAPKPYRCEMSDTDAAIIEVRLQAGRQAQSGGAAAMGHPAWSQLGCAGLGAPAPWDASGGTPQRSQYGRLPACPPARPRQMREEKKSERRAGAEWVGTTQLLRESVKEAEWGLVDGSGTEVPVVAGRRADGDYLQMSGDRL